MKHHVPRKLKKKAKKVKAAHDAMVITQSALASAMGISQIAVIVGVPISSPADMSLKALKSAMVCQDTAKAIAKCMAQIKPWYGHIQNYKSRTQ